MNDNRCNSNTITETTSVGLDRMMLYRHCPGQADQSDLGLEFLQINLDPFSYKFN